MTVLVLVGSYPPNLESSARLYSQLCESLVAAGHSVTVITEHPLGTAPMDPAHPYFMSRSSDAMLNGVRVLRVSPLQKLTRVPGGRALRFLVSCALYALRGLLLKRHSVILVYSPPLFMGIADYVLSIRHRARWVLNVQDLHPKVLFDSGVVRNQWIKTALIGMETICYRNADAFIVYSDGNRTYLQKRSAKGEIHVIPNWVDTAELSAVSVPNDFREEEGLSGKLLISYVGTMQSAQGLEVVIAAAELVRTQEDIVFFLAGEGTSKAALERLIEAKQLSNVRLLPVMTHDRHLQCLQTSDICLVPISIEVPRETVPGKLAYTMGCAKPILGVAHLGGDAAKIIQDARGGLCVSPGDGQGLADAVTMLYRNPALRAELGRNSGAYARAHFSRVACTRRYESVLTHMFTNRHDACAR